MGIFTNSKDSLKNWLGIQWQKSLSRKPFINSYATKGKPIPYFWILYRRFFSLHIHALYYREMSLTIVFPGNKVSGESLCHVNPYEGSSAKSIRLGRVLDKVCHTPSGGTTTQVSWLRPDLDRKFLFGCYLWYIYSFVFWGMAS